MRLLVNQRPFGERLFGRTGIKIKGLNVVPKASDIAAATDGTGWGKMWANFDWTGWIKPQVDLAKGLGANCVKITGSGATSDYPSDFLTTKVPAFLNYCKDNGLLVYWNYASSDWGGTVLAATAPVQALVRVLTAFPNVIGVDIANEVGAGSMMPIAQAQQLIPIARAAAPALPYTASIIVAVASFTSGTASAIVPYCDFADFHPYYVSGDPAPGDVADFRAAAYYKRFLIGECGQNVAAGTPAQTSRWTSLAGLSALSDCWGAVGFCVTDYNATPSNQWGVYATDLVTERTACTTPFRAWVGHR